MVSVCVCVPLRSLDSRSILACFIYFYSQVLDLRDTVELGVDRECMDCELERKSSENYHELYY